MDPRLDSISEGQFQALVVDAARQLGLAVYHTHDSRRSEPGFPDLVIVGKRGVMYRELKTAKGVLSMDQKYWLAILHAAGADAGVWRPGLWPAAITHELKVLGGLEIARPVKRRAIARQW